jgi:hypothetical protein
MISFVETCTNDNDNEIKIPGFHFVDGSNRKKHKKARRNSGGINIFVHISIVQVIPWQVLIRNIMVIFWI